MGALAARRQKVAQDIPDARAPLGLLVWAAAVATLVAEAGITAAKEFIRAEEVVALAS
jgi:hypothetical protein